jgi:hypothetical protein
MGGCVPTTEANKQTLYSCIGLGAVRFKSTKRMNFTKFQITSTPPTFWAAGLVVDGQQGGNQDRPVGDVQVGVHVR